MCTVTRSDGEREMPLGKKYDIDIELPYGEKFSESFISDLSDNSIRLQVGSRVVAEGEIL